LIKILDNAARHLHWTALVLSSHHEGQRRATTWELNSPNPTTLAVQL